MCVGWNSNLSIQIMVPCKNLWIDEMTHTIFKAAVSADSDDNSYISMLKQNVSDETASLLVPIFEWPQLLTYILSRLDRVKHSHVLVNFPT